MWSHHMPLVVEEKQTAFTYWTFSKVLRLSLIPYIGFWIWYDFIR